VLFSRKPPAWPLKNTAQRIMMFPDHRQRMQQTY